MSNTIYCLCVDCEVFKSLKQGEEASFKDKHWGHEIIIIDRHELDVTYYVPNENIRYAREVST